MTTNEFTNLCFDCGFVANHLTMLKRHGARSVKPVFDLSTTRNGVCDICYKCKAVAPLRDFFYPSERSMRFVRQYITKGGER